MSLTSHTRLFLGMSLLGASLTLPAGGANAAPVAWCSFPNCVAGTPATIGDKLFTAFSGPNLGSGAVDVDLTPANDPNGTYQVDVDLDPLLINSGATPITGIFHYKVDITDPARSFKTAGLSWAGHDSSVTKKIYSDMFTTLIQTLSINGDEQALPSGLKSIWVEDTYTVQPGGNLDNFLNTYTQKVPGPLPLVGAGAAFTFSRRLRRRTKTAYKLG